MQQIKRWAKARYHSDEFKIQIAINEYGSAAHASKVFEIHAVLWPGNIGPEFTFKLAHEVLVGNCLDLGSTMCKGWELDFIP